MMNCSQPGQLSSSPPLAASGGASMSSYSLPGPSGLSNSSSLRFNQQCTVDERPSVHETEEELAESSASEDELNEGAKCLRGHSSRAHNHHPTQLLGSSSSGKGHQQSSKSTASKNHSSSSSTATTNSSNGLTSNVTFFISNDEDEDIDSSVDNTGLSRLMASRQQSSLVDTDNEVDLVPHEQYSITSNGSKRSIRQGGGRSKNSMCADQNGSSRVDVLPGTAVPLPPHTITCRPISESSSVAQLSIASSCASDPSLPMCKICHLNAKDGDPLISPCRCAGTMQYIHCGCLMRWLEISSKKTRKPLSCELCQYQYHWHKKFKVRHWQFPHCSRKDKLLHLMFFMSVAVMVACAIVTVMCFKNDRNQRIDPNRTELTQSEVITLICGVLFFLAFFMAMYVEVKARNTLYKLLVKFVYLNQQWYIDEYDKKDSAPVDV